MLKAYHENSGEASNLLPKKDRLESGLCFCLGYIAGTGNKMLAHDLCRRSGHL
jgi:hypothetical protein